MKFALGFILIASMALHSPSLIAGTAAPRSSSDLGIAQGMLVLATLSILMLKTQSGLTSILKIQTSKAMHDWSEQSAS